MRRRRTMLLAATVAVLAILPRVARAQDAAGVRPHRMTVIPPAPDPTAGPGATSSAVSARSPIALASPGLDPAAVNAAANAVSSTGSAAQCRTACAAARYSCTSQDADGGDDCATAWGQCVVGCSGAGYPYSSTAPQVFAARAYGQTSSSNSNSASSQSPVD